MFFFFSFKFFFNIMWFDYTNFFFSFFCVTTAGKDYIFCHNKDCSYKREVEPMTAEAAELPEIGTTEE